MAEKSKRVEEVVWTGKSDRRIRPDKEFFEPAKSKSGQTVYKVTKDAPKAPEKTTAAEAGLAPKNPSAAAKAAPAAKPARPAATAEAPREPVRPASEISKSAASPVPAPAKPQAAPAPRPTTSREKSRVIAKTVVGSFVERMKTEAQRKGGTLTLKDIEALDHEFEKKTAALETLFEQTFQEYARSLVEDSGPEERRQHPFDRLIVGPFEKLLSGGDGPSMAKGGISRRILPGFFMAVNMMMGPDVMADFRIRAEKIFNRVNHDGDFDWSNFLDDSASRDLRMDALISMAVHFANPDKRAHWFMDLINSHMAAPETDPETDPDWVLSRPGYERLVDALFSDLMNAVASPRAREAITKRFGPETCASVAEIMKGLGA